ncbi:C-type lectin-like [Ostrea edulis]|uniref:C-type lectin-like n=1 Tax=Ostrea edulis TaxID=37623 RepID=UPI0024AEC92D|nr:C-type lectin-like [Ostrea edulis]
MMFSLFCLYIAANVLPANANALPGKPVDFVVFQEKLHDVHAGFQKSAKANGYLLTETHFETKVKTICTHSGCSSSAEEKKENDRECPKDWKKFSRNCYKLLSDKRAWNSGKSACKTLKANLADIISESEHLWLYKTFTGLKHFAWIDASDKAKNGKWRWSSSGKMSTYTAWNEEPKDSSGKKYCPYVYARGGKLHWSVTKCGVHQLQTLCKKKR